MSFLFVEFLGYILFKAFGPDVHVAGNAILASGSSREIVNSGDLRPLTQAIRNNDIGEGEVLGVAWFAFERIIGEFLASGWKASYLSARSRSRFIHDKDTRRRLYERFQGLEDYMCKAQLTEGWTVHLPPKTPISEYFKRIRSPESP